MLHALTRLLDAHGLAVVLMLLGLPLAVWQHTARRVVGHSPTLRLLGESLCCAALGGFFVPDEAGMWLAAACAAVLFFAFLVLLISGNWSRFLGLGLNYGLAIGFGSFVGTPTFRA